MALSNWDNLSFNHKGEVCEGIYKSPMGIVVETYKNWLHIKDEYAHRENPHVMQKPVIAKIETGELRYMDVSIKCEFQSDFDDSSNDSEDWHNNYNRILYCIWNSYDDEPDFTGICGIACMADMDSDDVEALKIFLEDKDKNIYSNIPERFKNIDLSKGKRYNQGDAYFHDVLGTDRQCTLVGESKDTIFSQIFNSNKDIQESNTTVKHVSYLNPFVIFDKKSDILYIYLYTPSCGIYEGIGVGVYVRHESSTNDIIGYMIENYSKQNIDELKKLLPENIHKYLDKK